MYYYYINIYFNVYLTYVINDYDYMINGSWYFVTLCISDIKMFDSSIVTAGCLCVKEHVCVCTSLWEVS